MKILQILFGEKELLKEVDEELVDILSTFESISKKLTLDKELEKYYQTIRNDIDMLENLKRSLNSWDKAYEINQNLKFPHGQGKSRI